MIRSLRTLVGVLAAVAFALPWVPGAGLLASERFSGYEIVGYAGHLGRLEWSPAEDAGLVAARLAAVGVAMVAAWMVLLGATGVAPAVYRWCGAYLALAAAVVTVAGLVLDPGMPQRGALLLVLAAALFVVTEAAGGGRPRRSRLTQRAVARTGGIAPAVEARATHPDTPPA